MATAGLEHLPDCGARHRHKQVSQNALLRTLCGDLGKFAANRATQKVLPPPHASECFLQTACVELGNFTANIPANS